MKRKLMYGAVALVLSVNLLIGARVYLNAAQTASKESPYPSLELFSVVLERVRKDYVDGQNVSYQELVYGALKGMLNTLDPHSEFMDPDKYKELQNDTQGAFGGLGIVFSGIPGTESVWLSAPLSVAGALFLAFVALWLFNMVFSKSQSSSESRVATLIGQTATIITPIPVNGTGEIAYVQAGSRYSAPARDERGARRPAQEHAGSSRAWPGLTRRPS